LGVESEREVRERQLARLPVAAVLGPGGGELLDPAGKLVRRPTPHDPAVAPPAGALERSVDGAADDQRRTLSLRAWPDLRLGLPVAIPDAPDLLERLVLPGPALGKRATADRRAVRAAAPPDPEHDSPAA